MTKERELLFTIVEQWGNAVYNKETLVRNYVFDFLEFREKYQRQERNKMIEVHAKLGGTTTWVGASDEKIYQEFISQPTQLIPDTK